ncbi:sugar transferase [Nocardioides albidus]|uniref:Sugar transferase n=1 Tax=Nocardioides albidus TaxID=1517589 RepID=A0A5C4W7D3_9ACTN|nr:sugar transferase [Nocardioides albidus]TNM44120.1 sugar transferase [Nocardioides albidus]
MHIKRVFDVVVVSLAAIAWLPAVMAGALLILLSSGRPVFYRSNRLVDSGEPTKVVKFRTMVKNADKLVNRDTVPVTSTRFLNIAPNSPLYTKAGRLLERCGLTEIPQLFHVLSGKMSIVGNRPLPTNVMNALLDEYAYAGDRFLTPAGLTGPAQLVGRDALSDSERLRVEGAYCHAVLDGYRLRLDFTILLSTVLIVAHLKESMTYSEVMAMIERNSRSRSVASLEDRYAPATDNTEVA